MPKPARTNLNGPRVAKRLQQQQSSLQQQITSVKKKVKNDKKKVNQVARIEKAIVQSTGPLSRQATQTFGMEKAARSIYRQLPKTSRAIANIMQFFTLPKESPPMRLSSMYTVQKTASANPWFSQDVPWLKLTAYNAAKQQLPASEWVCYLFRNPLRALVCYDANPAAQTWTYQFYGSFGTNAPATFWTYGLPMQDSQDYVFIPYAVPTSGYTPHGPMWFAGYAPACPKGRFFWMDNTNTMVFSLSGLTTGHVYTVYADQYNDGQVVRQVFSGSLTAAGSTGTVTVTCTKSGYYAFRLNFPDANVTISSLNMNGGIAGMSTFQHLSLPNFGTQILNTLGARIMAGAILITNQAALINLQGKIFAVQQPRGTDWQSLAQPTDPVSAEDPRYFTDAKTGVYGFLKPSKVTDLDMQCCWQVDGGVLQDAAYNLQNESDFLAIRTSITTQGGQDATMQPVWGVEFLTTNVWFEKKEPDADYQLWEKAQCHLRDLPQWHENPLHWGEIWSKITDVANGVINGIEKYGPTAIKIAGMLKPLLL